MKRQPSCKIACCKYNVEVKGGEGPEQLGDRRLTPQVSESRIRQPAKGYTGVPRQPHANGPGPTHEDPTDGPGPTGATPQARHGPRPARAKMPQTAIRDCSGEPHHRSGTGGANTTEARPYKGSDLH